jgi:hypothetical protein
VVIGVMLLGIAFGIARFPGTQLLIGLFQIGSQILFVAGGWLLTTPDPSGIGEQEYGTPRKIIRITLIIGACSQLLSFADAISAPPPAAHLAISSIAGIAGLAGAVGQFAQLLYLSKLALRIPDDKLSARARFLMWAIGISYGLIVVFGLILVIATGGARNIGRPGAGLAVTGCFMAILVIALCVFGLMYLSLLEKLGKRFKEQALVAEQNWKLPVS